MIVPARHRALLIALLIRISDVSATCVDTSPSCSGQETIGGSVLGGTRLFLHGGLGFFSATRNVVPYVNAAEMSMVEYYSTPDMIVADTPQGLGPGTYMISAMVDGYTPVVFSQTVTYDLAYTPRVSACSLVGNALTIGGNFTTDGSAPAWTSIAINGAPCFANTTTTKQIDCTLSPLSLPGTAIASVHLPLGYAANESCVFKVLTTVSSVSPATGSSNGGLMLTITGASFGSSPTVVAGGSPCAIRSLAATKLTCLTSAAVPGSEGSLVVSGTSWPGA